MPVREFLAEAGEVGAVLGMKSLGLVQRQLLLESTVTAYQDCFLLMTALCVVVMPLVFFIRRAPGRSYNRSLSDRQGRKDHARRHHCLRDRRLASMPVGVLLVGMRHTQHRRLIKGLAGDLQADRQAGRRETAGDRYRRQAREIKRPHEP